MHASATVHLHVQHVLVTILSWRRIGLLCNTVFLMTMQHEGDCMAMHVFTRMTLQMCSQVPDRSVQLLLACCRNNLFLELIIVIYIVVLRS